MSPVEIEKLLERKIEFMGGSEIREFVGRGGLEQKRWGKPKYSIKSREGKKRGKMKKFQEIGGGTNPGGHYVY